MTTTPERSPTSEAKCETCDGTRVNPLWSAGERYAAMDCPDCTATNSGEKVHDYHGLCRENKQLADKLFAAETELQRLRASRSDVSGDVS